MKMIGSLKYDLLSVEELEEKRIQKELEKMDSIIKSSLNDKLDFTDTEERLESISCERVDGFIPSSHNKGGYSVSAMVLSLETALTNVNDDEATAKLNELISDADKEVGTELFKEKAEELESKGVTSYQEFVEYMKNNNEYDEIYNDRHNEYCDDEAVRFELRVMFNGFDGEKYNFTVDSQVNWEFPYFRDGKGCSAYKEVDLEISNSDELSSSLEGALKEVLTLFNK